MEVHMQKIYEISNKYIEIYNNDNNFIKNS